MRKSALLLFCAAALASAARVNITGERKLWRCVTLTFDGPAAAEDSLPNPFRDYRLEVVFTHAGGARYRVPGFFAGDGRAAETSARSGNRWRVRFVPDAAGLWRFAVSFRAGPDVALSPDPEAGRPLPPDGLSGTFSVAAGEQSGRDPRDRGLLRYTGEHYLRWAGSGERFLKGGADSPENFLAYFEFDGTFDTDPAPNEGPSMGKPFLHRYEPHARDWRPGDPVWKKKRGKNIIGALNYLASKGMNSVYFLTYNLDGGDGKDVWMWISPESRDRYDLSKLDQWEIVFSHMDRLGIQLHVVTQETENDRKLGGGPGLNPIRRLYYRELVARFAHHLALIWNLGEENNTPDADRKQIARYIRDLDPYRHPITVHTHNNRAPDFYNGLLGDPHFEATSIQGRMENYYRDAVLLRRRSAGAGRPWVIFGDEQPSAQVGVPPDEADPEHNLPRIEALWGNLMGGGSGVEWYFGYQFPHNDLTCEDWRTRERMWDQTRYALEFFRRHLPFWEMTPLEAEGARVLAKPGEVYAVQLPRGGTATLELPEGSYSLWWYNPRTGGELIEGQLAPAAGSGRRRIGPPPAEGNKDWVALIRRRPPPATGR